MTTIGKYARLTVIVLVVGLFTGCLGGGSSTTPTYSLMVKVLDDATGTPIAGAVVKIVGKDISEEETNASGQVSFPKLSGSVEVLVEALGYVSETKTVAMTKEQSVTVRLAIDATGSVVRSQEELVEAIAKEDVTSIILAESVVLEEKLVIERPVQLNLLGQTITGDVEYAFDDTDELELAGSGQIDGNLVINAPNATVTNRLRVTGTVSIVDVASSTWHEHATGNRFVISGSDLEVHLYNGATSVEISSATSGVRLTIHGGTVATLLANSSVRVSGADRIELATVNAPGVVFDLSPQEVEGDYNPTIMQPFVPGTGGTIPAFTPSMLEPETFGGLYLQRNHRWPSFNASTTSHPVVDMYFPTPESLGGDGYVLQTYDSSDFTWKQYEDVETSSASSNNFSITYWNDSKFRLMMVGGPFDGYTSNEIEVPVSSVQTYFSNWGMTVTEPYVGQTYTGYAIAKRISDGSTIDASYLTYQWYRVDPVTMDMKEIPGATNTQYTIQDDDAGYAILFRASGDGTKIGGALQIWASSLYDQTPKPTLIPNKAYISDVGANSLTLNLHKNVASLAKEDIEIWAYGPNTNEPLAIQSVEFVPGSDSRVVIEVEIPSGLESLWLTAKTGNWGTVSNYIGEAPYIRSDVIYYF